MSIRFGIILSYIVLVSVGFYKQAQWTMNDLRRHYLEAMEESLVDFSRTLAAFVETRVNEMGEIQTDGLDAIFKRSVDQPLNAKIYDLIKTRVDTRVYIVNARGIVIFDSDQSREVGMDRSRSNDVFLTLQGKYGARSTRTDPEDPRTSILYIGSPIRWKDRIVGCVTVCKPTTHVHLLMDAAKEQIVWTASIYSLCVIALGLAFSNWLLAPIYQLASYVSQVRDGKRVTAPRFIFSEIGVLHRCFEELRETLEGKKYVERYVESLTHEIKSPLAAIRGAAELLSEPDMPNDQRIRFLSNIQEESARLQNIIDRLLQLSALENKKRLEERVHINLNQLVSALHSRASDNGRSKNLVIGLTLCDHASISGDLFLIEYALWNLLDNAISFSDSGGQIEIKTEKHDNAIIFSVRDHGPGIPEFALAKIYDRFYSLPRPSTGRKSSGLGLCLAKEVAELHGAKLTLVNHPEGGVLAQVEFNPEDPMVDFTKR